MEGVVIYRKEVVMKLSDAQIFWWTPRVLACLFAIFVSLFALEVFGVGYGFWETSLAYLIHLVPVYLTAKRSSIRQLQPVMVDLTDYLT